MNWITTLWDREKQNWDSTVLTDWTKCFKLYPLEYWIEWLDLYIETQNRIPSIKITFPHWIDLWVWIPIKEFEIDFLGLFLDIYEASDIKTREAILVSEIEYIEWESLWDLINQSNRFQWLEYKILPLLHRIQEYISEESWLDMNTNEKWKNHHYLKYQINSHNIKIQSIDIENQKAKLIVTDICMQIYEFIQRNRVITKNLLLMKK